MLAEKVCDLFGDYCCTNIPNNTVSEGIFTVAVNKLKNLRQNIQKCRKGMYTWDWFDSMFKQWGAMLTKMGIMLA